MFSEAHFAGILFAPIVLYGLIAAVIFVPIRYWLGRTGFLQWLWHTSLFELSLYICICALVIFIAA
ncbi:MAG: hypothetical protein B7Z78_06000 [Rhodospirillales bacterium 20-60-12]|nr:MAG: hypothetical protein B7Z78_06000 [Rhodospirillales bacterium 20-60-12]HQT66217.1 DUF1656 domain-containing protein [Acetobacteraceae bacterium]